MNGHHPGGLGGGRPPAAAGPGTAELGPSLDDKAPLLVFLCPGRPSQPFVSLGRFLLLSYRSFYGGFLCVQSFWVSWPTHSHSVTGMYLIGSLSSKGDGVVVLPSTLSLSTAIGRHNNEYGQGDLLAWVASPCVLCVLVVGHCNGFVFGKGALCG